MVVWVMRSGFMSAMEELFRGRLTRSRYCHRVGEVPPSDIGLGLRDVELCEMDLVKYRVTFQTLQLAQIAIKDVTPDPSLTPNTAGW